MREGAATGINDAGQVAGESPVGSTTNGFRWTSGTYEEFPGLPDFPYLSPFGINALGYVVGQAAGPGGTDAVLWTEHTAYSLGTHLRRDLPPDERFLRTWAAAINEMGQIAIVDVVQTALGGWTNIPALWQPASPGATSGTLYQLGLLSGA
ncbi:MAG TPA: hypothetical protein VJV04_10800, partial [Nitrospiraceae bacterium]|nr:hypothetical protein [Nitrospiraceae bacterium]